MHEHLPKPRWFYRVSYGQYKSSGSCNSDATALSLDTLTPGNHLGGVQPVVN